MFNCYQCKKKVGPRVSKAQYTKIIASRPKTYRNKKGSDIVFSIGSEIVKEAAFCSDCFKNV